MAQNSEGPLAVAAVWDQTVSLCLEEATWNFAMVSDEMTGIETTDEVGWTYEYALPADFERLDRVRDIDDPIDEDDGDFKTVVYDLENGKLYCAEPSIRIRYVSSTRGADPTYWPPSFEHFVAYSLAKSCPSLHGSANVSQMIHRGEQRYRRQARQKDAVQQATRPLQRGRFVRAHLGADRFRGWARSN